MLEMMRQPGSSAERIAHVIQNDPALASKVLRTVNSSYYGLSKPCPNITRAVALLGINTVKSITLGLSLVEMGRSAGEGLELVAYWRRAVYCAAAARLIAKHSRGCDPDEAFVAALLQDVGMLASFAALGREYAKVAKAGEADHDQLLEAERAALNFDHAEIGAQMGEKWRLPEQIVAATRFHHRPEGATEPNVSIVRVVAASGDAAAALAVTDPQPKLVSFRKRMRAWFDTDGQTADELVRQTSLAAKELAKLLDLDTGAAPDINAILAEASEELLHHQLEMEREQTSLTRQAVTDALTGLYNRMHFDGEIARAIDRARGSGGAVSVLFCDADKFKLVNDQLGHQAGDVVLVEIARRLRDVVGPAGVVCRYGGEEFAIVLPDTGLAPAMDLAEQVRKAMAGMPIDLSKLGVSGREHRQTISVGVAGLERGSNMYLNAEALVRAADEALYAAKKAGRNRVCCAGAAVPAQEAPARPAALADGKRTILIVEDDVLSAKMLEVLLSKHGNLRVVQAQSAEQAIKLLRDGGKDAPCHPDLVLLDNNLPGKSGTDLLREMKQAPRLRSIPVVMMSASTNEAERKAAVALGACAYLDKADMCADFGASIRLVTGFLRPAQAKAA